MFRDLKEYQEIAKIYADKVSKPEILKRTVIQEVRNFVKKEKQINHPKHQRLNQLISQIEIN